MILFKNTILKNRATSIIKNQPPLSYLALNDVPIFSRNGPITFDLRIVNSHSTKGTRWVAYSNQNHFDSYGSSPPQKLCSFIIKRNGYCLYSEYKIQGLDFYCAAYCSIKIYFTKVIGMDFKSAFSKLFNQTISYQLNDVLEIDN